MKDWTDYRKRIKGICDAIVSGAAEDEDPTPQTIDIVEGADPKKLKPLSLSYERGSQEHKLKRPARGDSPGGVATEVAALEGCFFAPEQCGDCTAISNLQEFISSIMSTTEEESIAQMIEKRE